MNPIGISVTPSPYVRPAVSITNVQIRVINVVLFKSVNLNVTLMAGNDFVDVKTFLLEGADYTNWANDDTYIVNYGLTQLGLTEVIVPAAALADEPAAALADELADEPAAALADEPAAALADEPAAALAEEPAA